MRGDRRAIELAELVDGELGPGFVTVLFTDGGGLATSEVLCAQGLIPWEVLAAFMGRAAQEQRRLGDGR